MGVTSRGTISVWVMLGVVVLCVMYVSTASVKKDVQEYGRAQRRARSAPPTSMYVLACYSNPLVLSCSSSLYLKIHEVTYGRLDSVTCYRNNDTEVASICYNDVVDVIREQCEGLTYCMPRVNDDNFGGNPCAGQDVYKYAEATYSCLSKDAFTTTITPPVIGTTPAKEEITYCESFDYHDVTWDKVESGLIDEKSCPDSDDESKLAYMTCDGSPAEWQLDTLDMSLCTSDWVDELEDVVSSGANATTITSALSSVTSSTSDYQGGDLTASTDIMTSVIEEVVEEITTMSQEEAQEVTETVTTDLAVTSSNLLSEEAASSWEELPTTLRTTTASTLVNTLEMSAFLVAETLDPGDNFITLTDNTFVEITKIEEDIETALTFDGFTSTDKTTSNSIYLSTSIMASATSTGSTNMVYMEFSGLGSLLSSLSSSSSSRRRRRSVDEDQSTDSDSDEETVISNVVSLSIGDSSTRTYFDEQIIITLSHNSDDENITAGLCVYWNYTDADQGGYWASDGCEVLSTNSTMTQCGCYHLTNFAILLDHQDTEFTPGHNLALIVITYVGCVISIICLSIAFFTFVYFRNLKSDRTTIHANLCLTLLLAEVLFLVGIGRTENATVCSVIAGFLHYFFLAAFVWMCLEGVQLYVMLIEVFEAKHSRAKYYYVFGYGLPTLVVACAAGVAPDGYGTDEFCWLRTDNNFIWSFIGPVCVIMFANMIFLGIAIFMMCRHARNHRQKKSKADSVRRSDEISWVKGSLVLVCLLGITWIFGLLFIKDVSVVMAYLFTIFNTLQGMFIFIFHVLMNEKVRKEYRRTLRRSPWCPQCVRDRADASITKENNTSSRSSGSSRLKNMLKARRRSSGSTSLDSNKAATENNKYNNKYKPNNNADGTNPTSGVQEANPLLGKTPAGTVAVAATEPDSGLKRDPDKDPDLEEIRKHVEDHAVDPDIQDIQNMISNGPIAGDKPASDSQKRSNSLLDLFNFLGIPVDRIPSRSGSSHSLQYQRFSTIEEDLPEKSPGYHKSMPNLLDDISPVDSCFNFDPKSKTSSLPDQTDDVSPPDEVDTSEHSIPSIAYSKPGSDEGKQASRASVASYETNV